MLPVGLAPQSLSSELQDAVARALGVVRIDRRERAVRAESPLDRILQVAGRRLRREAAGQHQQAFALRAAVFAAAAARRLMPAAAVRARTRCA